MASACVNHATESFVDVSPAKCPSYGWLSPRVSVSGDLDLKHVSPKKQAKPSNAELDLEDFVDFEFRLDDAVTMLPADELFSDGKLVPLQLTNVRQSAVTPDKGCTAEVVVSADEAEAETRQDKEICSTDACLFSPKAPTCSIRWKELLGLKKLYQKQSDDDKMTSSPPSSRSIKFTPRRTSKPSSPAAESCLSSPLLESESIPLPSRFSLSSTSSSGREHDEVPLPRLSLDTDKQPCTATRSNRLAKARLSKHRKPSSSSENPRAASNRASRSAVKREQAPAEPTTTADSPRMNASGKVVFHGLERSSSSPSTFYGGGPTYKCRGVERSYSAHVRVAPVLNVPVCSLRGSSKFGFPLFSSSSQHKRDNSHYVSAKRNQEANNSQNRTDRT